MSSVMPPEVARTIARARRIIEDARSLQASDSVSTLRATIDALAELGDCMTGLVESQAEMAAELFERMRG